MPRIGACCLLLFLACACLAADKDGPLLEPAPTRDLHEVWIRQGVALYEAGELDRAETLFQDVLKQNPDDVLALYESTLAQWKMRNYSECAKRARRGTRYRSTLLSQFYALAGVCLETAERPDEAKELYRRGVAADPEDALLRFNYGLTLYRYGETDAAKTQVKTALVLDPLHVSSNVVLAELFLREGLELPALLACLRTLVLDPAGARAPSVLGYAERILKGRISEGSDGVLNIALDLDEPKSEGDFSAAATYLALHAATRRLPEAEPGAEKRTPLEERVSLIESLIAMIADEARQAEKTAFSARYYGRYFAEAADLGHLEALLVRAHFTAWPEEAKQWLEEHRESIEEALEWSARYQSWDGIAISNTN